LAARAVLSPAARWRNALTVYAVLLTLAFGGGLAVAISRDLLAPYAWTGFAVAGVLALPAGAWRAVVLSARDARRAMLAASSGWGGLYLACILALPRLSSELSTEELAYAAISTGPAAPIVAYRTYPQGFAWNLRETIPVADYVGELASDGARPDSIFW